MMNGREHSPAVSGRQNVIQLPADVDPSALPEEIEVGKVFHVGGCAYVCVEAGIAGFSVAADRGAAYATTPLRVDRFLVVRRAF